MDGTMSTSQNISIKKYQWDYYAKLSDFEAQCKFCDKKYIYINYSNFSTHIAKSHQEIWKYEEERKEIILPWRYFKYFSDLQSQCVVCDATVPSIIKSVEKHLSLHSLQQLEYISRCTWQSKYCTIKDDFVIECNICHNNVVLNVNFSLNRHLKKMHSDKLEDTQETHDIVGSSKRVSLLQTDTLSMSPTIVTKEHLWNYYEKLPGFQAQCKFCENKYCYVCMTNFQIHVVTHHADVWTYEKEKQLTKWPWRYFKYLDNTYSRCIICVATVLSTIESAENHLSLHSLHQLEGTIYRGWTWKYYTQKDDFAVACNICNKSLILSFRNISVNPHTEKTHSDKIKNTPATHGTVSSSKHISSFQTDKMLNSLSIATKKNMWDFYVKMPDYKARCKFCENTYNYIGTRNFQRHIAGRHKDIWKYEIEDKLIKRPYLKYFDNIYLQCIICNATVLSTIESIQNHSSLHSLQLEDSVYRDWSWKYCIQKDDFAVECNICHNIIQLYINKHSLDYHIKKTHPEKIKDTQEVRDTDLKRVSMFKTDKTAKLILSLKDCYVLLKKCPHYDLYM